MRRFILLLITLFSVTSLMGQLQDDCATAEANVYNITAGDLPSYSVMNVALSTTDDGSYQPSQIGAAWENSYYAFTVPAGGFFTISVANGTPSPPSGELSIGLAEDDCLPFTTDSDAQELGFGDLSAGSSVSSTCEFLTPGTTYIIGLAVAPGTGGTVTLSITESAAPSNDDCVSATGLTSGAPAASTNSCASSADVCAQDNTTNHVSWFSFSKTATDPAVDLEIVVTDNGSPADATSVNIALFENCGGTVSTLMPETGDLCGTALNTTYNFTCVSDDIIYIAVGSEDGEEGDFTITVTESNPSPSNDVCSDPLAGIGATPLGTLADCEWETFSLDNTNACPETFDDAACNLDMDAVVWYSFTLPANATGVEVGGLTNSGYVALYASCPTGGGNALTPGCVSETTLTNAELFTGLIGGNTYFMAAAIINQAEGSFDVQLKAIVPPANDECANATPITAAAALDGTTNCAGPSFGGVCALDVTNSHDVFYSYTNGTGGNVDLELTITGNTATTGTAAAEISIIVYTDACDGTVYTDVLDADICNTLGTAAAFDCIEDGESIIFMVASSDGDEGDFNISLTENTDQPGANNDNCDTPSDVSPSTTCTWETVGVDNISACPEAFSVTGGCDFNMDNTVWYEFTVPATGSNYTVQFQNISPAAYMAMFNDNSNCDAPVIEPGVPCMTGVGPFGPFTVTANTTYYLAVGEATVGTHTFEIRINEPPANDDCADAEALADGVNTGYTTSCATQENPITFNSTVCTDDDEVNTVWFTYEVPAGNKGFNITLTAAGANGFVGDANIVVFETASPACDFNNTVVGEVCTTTGTEETEFECVGPGVYTIRVSTSSVNEGDFDINIEALMAVAADFCDDPNTTAFDPIADCAWVQATAATVGACPEANDFANDCGFDEFPVVWYEVTAPAGASFLDLSIVSATVGAPFIGVYEGNPMDCDNLTETSDCYSGIFDDLDEIGEDLIDVMGGDTYLIGVGTDDIVGGDVVFEIKFIVPPVNDECADAEPLAAGDNTGYTTSCATQEDPITFNSTVCTDDDEVNTVWFTYTVPPGDKGFNITLTAAGASGFMGDANVVVFETTSPVCDFNMTDVEQVCTTSGMEETTFECVGPGDYVIRISTSTDNEGDFDINIEALAAVAADFCDDPDVTVFTGIGECIWTPTVATTVGACPETNDFANDCGFDEFPVIWYEVTAPAGATFLDLRVNSATVGTPFIGVYEGNPVDCDNLTETSDCYTGAFTDLVASGETLIDVMGGNTYLIGVGTDDVVGGDIDFEIKFIVPPVNDECADAESLSAGDNTGFTTSCATQEDPITFDSNVCTDDDEVNTVWFTYTVPPGDKGFNITLTAAGASGFMGDANVVVFETTSPVCDFNMTDVEEVCTTSGMEETTFECVGPGDYVIRISTSTDNEGDFDINIEALVEEQLNDACDNAELINLVPDCVFVTVSGNNTGACPEDFDESSCEFDEDLIVWYEVEVPADGVGLEFADLSPDLFIGVFEDDCENLTLVGTLNGGASDCIDDDAQILDLTPGIYLLGVGFSNMDIGPFTFDVKTIVPPGNDDPCDVTGGSPYDVTTAGDTDVTISGTNECATQDFTDPACVPEGESSVYYYYEVPAGTNGITVTLANTGEGTGFMLAGYDFADCNGAPTAFDGAVDPVCNAQNGGELEYNCLEEGDVIIIMVSTLPDNAGTFDLTIDPLVPEPECVANDLCENANDTWDGAMPVTDDPIVCADHCNLESCPEEWTAGVDCDYANLPTVFFSVTTDANAIDATMTVNITGNGTNPIDPVFSIIEACGNPPTALPDALCITDGSITGVEVMPNTTYIIVVADGNTLDDINGGDFNICVAVSTSCNDDPCSPYELDSSGAGEFTALDCNTNIGSTEDQTYTSDCGGAEFTESSVYFQYTGGVNIAFVDITVESDASNGTPLPGTTVVTVFEIDPSDCALNLTNLEVGQECGDIASLEDIRITCPEENSLYLIQVATAAGDEGDFNITVVETEKTDACAVNDVCDAATVLDVVECVETVITDCNAQSCPESFVGGACNFEGSPVVWFTFTTPAGTYGGSFEATPAASNGLQDISMAILLEQGCLDVPTAVNGDAVCVTGPAELEDLPLEPNTQYSIIIGTTNTDPATQEGFFDLTYTIFVAPENDDPCNASENPPFDLSGGGSHSGTTCCARGFNDPDNGEDQRNVDCNTITDDNAVWYTYTPGADDDGVDISVTGNGITGNTAVEVYWGQPDAGCIEGSFGETALSSCGSLPFEGKIGNCAPEDGDILFVKVTSTDADCGEFDISVTPASCAGGEMYDDCQEAADATPIEPITNEMFEIDYICIQGCLDYACPEEDALGGCGGFLESPTVWFHVTADDLAAQMFTTVEAGGLWTPIWSVYSGPDCDNLAVVNFGGSPPCSNGDSTPELHQTSVFDDEENYWIAVTADPASIPPGGIEDGSFELCVATTINAIICLGELEGGNCADESLVMEVVDRENMELPLEGPFCQGEEITINISFFYDATDSGADWLIGFVPTFGPGWDMENFDFVANAPTGDGATGEWFEAEGPCAPLIQEPNPILCTFEDEDGVLQICNLLCDPCTECEDGTLQEGDPLPSGYFWLSQGNNAGCENDCSPGEAWGIGSTTSQIDWTFTLTVKEFDTQEECFENNSLAISFQTFSDGVGGCWEDPQGECILDRAMFSPPWLIDCISPPKVIADDVEICSGDEAGLMVETIDGTSFPIEVTFIDNPFVDGEGTGTNGLNFPGGFGTINDILINNSDVPQEVIYSGVVVAPDDFTCPGNPTDYIVTVYPDLIVEFIPNPDYVCQGECKDISPVLSGGTGVYVGYEWDTGETTPSIEVCPEFLTTYFVTVTDELGCTGIGFVDMDVKDSLVFDLGPDLQICQDGFFDGLNPGFIVSVDVIQGSSPINWVYDPEPGLIGFEVFPGSWGINEENSIDQNNDGLDLCFIGTDFFGCSSEKCIKIFISGEPEIFIFEDPLECGETEFCFDVTASDVNFNPIPNLIIRSCDGDLLWDFDGSFTGNFDPPCFDLNEFSCFEITAFDPLSGCEAVTILEKMPTTGVPIVVADESVCEGDEVTVTITNAADYTDFEWTVAGDASATIVSTTASYTFTPDSTTTLFVTTEDATGCTASESAVVTFNAAPVVNLAEDFTFCAGGSATAEVAGGVSYSWTVGAVEVSTTPTYTSSTDGEVATVTVTDANGCTGTATTTFSEETEIIINILGSNLCDGAQTELSFSGDFVNIVWSDGTTDVDSIFVTAGGTYTVSAEDATGCPASGSITIEEFTTPTINVTELVDVCRDDSGVDSTFINFNNLVSGDAGVWTQIDAVPAPFTFTPPLSNVSFLGVPSGQYQFRYTTNTATMPCMNVSDTVTINVKSCPCPSVDVRSPQPICNDGGTVNLNSAGVKITGEDGTWTVESGPPTQDLAGIISGAIFTADGILAGDYGVLFTLADSGGPNCQEDSLITVTVIEGPFAERLMDGRICSVAGGSDPITVDLNTLIDATGGGVWTDSDNMVVTNTTIDGTTITGMLPVTLTFTYTTMLPADSPCNDVSVTVDVVVRDCNCPLVEVGDSTICNSADAILLDELLENPDGLSGTWSSAAAGAVVGNQFDPGALSNGTFVITYTLDASPGPNCPLEYTGSIQVRRQPELTLLSPPPPCSADTGNGATTTNLYDWIDDGGTNGTWVLTSGPNPLVLDDQGGDNVIVDFDTETPGNEYTFTYTANSVNAPCVNPEIVVTIVVADCECPPIDIVQPDPVCNDGGTLDLTTLVDGSTGGVVSDPGTFTIVRVGTSNMPTLNGTVLDYTDLQAGNYLITYTLDQMVTGTCTQSVSDTLSISNYRTVTLQETLSICNNNDNGNLSIVNFLTLPSNGGIGTWASLDGDVVDLSSLTNVNFQGVTPGDYRFEYTVDNDEPCDDFSAIITITVDPCDCPLYNPGPTSPQCITDGNTMIDLTQWDDAAQPGTWSSDDFPVTGGVLDATGATAGDYQIIYTITEVPADPDCPTTDTLILSLQLPATAGTAADVAVCLGDDDVIDLTGQLTGADSGGSWTEVGAASGGLDPLAATFNTTGLMAGTYQLQYGFSAVGECPESFTTLVVTVEDLPIADAGADFELSCDDPTTTIGGGGTSSGNGFSYLWEEIESGLTVVDASSATTTVSAAGLYRLTVTNDATGCMSMDEVRITESDDKPSITLSTTDVTCAGDSDGQVAVSDATGGDGNYEYSIDGGPFGPLNPASLVGLAPGDYTIEIRDGNGCSTPYTFTINEPAPVAVSITQAPIITGELGAEFVITLDAIDTVGLTIIWTTTSVGGPEIARNVTSITVSPEENTQYYVEVFDANGCSANDNVQLQLQQIVDVTFPSIFNPQDNDGNSTFYINSNDVRTVDKLAIYDRWGNLVFIREGFPPNDPTLGWDGTFRGQDATEGVYVFYVELTFVNDENLTTSGDVTIVR